MKKHLSPTRTGVILVMSFATVLFAAWDDLTRANVVSALNGVTIPSATVASGDKIVIQDTDDSDSLKTVTAQSTADLHGATLKIAATGVYETAQTGVEYIGPNQHGGIYGTVYRQYYSGTLSSPGNGSLWTGSPVVLATLGAGTMRGQGFYVTTGTAIFTGGHARSATIWLAMPTMDISDGEVKSVWGSDLDGNAFYGHVDYTK